MSSKRLLTTTTASFIAVLILLVTNANASLVESHIQGATLSGVPDYNWWYGCSPTSVGMMMGYYDRRGYDNLIPGGVAELSNYGNDNAIVNAAIASQGHINAFHIGDTGVSGDDILNTGHAPDSLADFMGTSQDSVGNANGSTSFFTWDGSSDKFFYTDIEGTANQDASGMYGIKEYVEYRGYGIANLYNQKTDNAISGGFSFADYKAEIDAGRVVMIHVEEHSMFGYGYDDSGKIILHDTWTEGEHSMTWGGEYENRALWAVTVLELAPVPVPGSIFLIGTGLIVLVGRYRSKQR